MKTFYPQLLAALKGKPLKRAVLAAVTLVTLLPVKLFAQAPAISYSSPQTYITGTAITALTPGSSGGAVAAPAYSSSSVALPTSINPLLGFLAPLSVATDAAGDVYAGCVTGNIREYPAGGGSLISIGSGIGVPAGVAVDAAGNVYVADEGNSQVKEFPVGGGGPVILGSGFVSPDGVAVDAAGNVYVSDAGLTAIMEIPAGNGSLVTLGSGFLNPYGVAVDAAGNVYVADAGHNLIAEIPAGNGAPVTLASGFNAPTGIAVDAEGNIFVADHGNNEVKEIPAGSGTPLVIGSGPVGLGVAVDGAGNVYVADGVHNVVRQIKPLGGYFIGPFLPAGLSFNNATGVISGTPNAAGGSATANYTVTAYNSVGSGKATVNLTVIQAPVISYSSPQTYTVGTAVTALTPTQAGGAVAAYGYSGSPVTIASGLGEPDAVAVDALGNVYIANSDSTVITKIPAGGGTPVAIGSGFKTPFGVAVDAAGNVYVADSGNNAVKEIPAGGGLVVTIGTGFSFPTGVAVDAAGNVYVNAGALFEILAAGGATVTLELGFGTQGGGIAVDAAGNIYAIGGSPNDGGPPPTFSLYKIAPGGRSKVAIAPGFNVAGLAADAAGNVYVCNNHSIKVFPAPTGAGSSQFTISADSNLTTGIAVDAAGNVYVTYQNNGVVKEIKPVGGYFISPFLPAGLSFNTNTGVISGTPTAVSAAANYTVTAYNSAGSGTAAVNIKVNPLTPPAISYSSPQTYAAGTAIAALAPTSVGGAVAAYGYSSSQLTIASGFGSLAGVAADALGNVYIVNVDSTVITKQPAGGGRPVAIGSGFKQPTSVAVDGAGNVYVSDSGNGAIKEILAAGGTVKTIGSGFSGPAGVAVDGAGNVYVVNGTNVVSEILAGGATVTLRSGFISLNGVAVDAAGNIYVIDIDNGAVNGGTLYMIPANRSATVSITSGISQPYGIAVDAAGNVYLADGGSTAITVIPAGGSQFTIGSGPDVPSGVAVDAAGNVYVANPNHGEVNEIKPVGGYFIGPFLPAGLNFSTNTGIISGKPTVVSPATNYTVTAYNSEGSGTAAVNLKVIPTGDANLTGLSSSNDTLSPVFSPGTTSYNIAVGNGLTTMRVTPTADDPNATITVQGQAVTTGQPSQYLTLTTGVNAIPIVVTAQDGVTTQTYTLNIKEAKSGNAKLVSLKRSSGIIIPGFTANGTTYTENVGNGTATMSVIPTAANVNATITVNGTAVASGSPSPTYNLTEGGATVITVVVTAQLGNTKTYTLTVNRSLSSDASLSSLQISAGTLVPTFQPLTLLNSYGAKVSSSITMIQVTPTATNANIQGITVNTATVSSGSPSGLITLNPGSNPITIVVTAQDGTQRTYTVTINRVTNDASLSNLQVNVGTLTPAFEPLTQQDNYGANEANGTSSINVTATTTDPNATVTINTNTVTSGQPTAVGVSTGTNPVTITVTAADGSTMRTYNLSINVAAPPADNTAYQPVSVEKPADSPTLANDGITVHQAISPNGDGINDFLQIDNISQYPDNKLSIMNRNGQLIYEASGYDNSSKIFDGHSNKNGRMQLPGTYFYQLDYTINGITKHKTGFLVLKY